MSSSLPLNRFWNQLNGFSLATHAEHCGPTQWHTTRFIRPSWLEETCSVYNSPNPSPGVFMMLDRKLRSALALMILVRMYVLRACVVI